MIPYSNVIKCEGMHSFRHNTDIGRTDRQYWHWTNRQAVLARTDRQDGQTVLTLDGQIGSTDIGRTDRQYCWNSIALCINSLLMHDKNWKKLRKLEDRLKTRRLLCLRIRQLREESIAVDTHALMSALRSGCPCYMSLKTIGSSGWGPYWTGVRLFNDAM